MNDAVRKRELAKIHIGAKQLGMDPQDASPESDYRRMLWTVARVRSARDLDAAGRRAVLDHLRALGFRPARRPHRGAPHNLDSDERGPQLRKIEAMLAAADRPWAYADGIAQRMFQVARVTWCNPTQLRKVIAALSYDARRHDR